MTTRNRQKKKTKQNIYIQCIQSARLRIERNINGYREKEEEEEAKKDNGCFEMVIKH